MISSHFSSRLDSNNRVGDEQAIHVFLRRGTRERFVQFAEQRFVPAGRSVREPRAARLAYIAPQRRS